MTSRKNCNFKMAAARSLWREVQMVSVAVLLLASSSESQGQSGFYFGQGDSRFSPNFQQNGGQTGAGSFFDQGSFNQFRPAGPEYSQQQVFSGQSQAFSGQPAQGFSDPRFSGRAASPFQVPNGRSQPSGQYYLNQADFVPLQNNPETLPRPGTYQSRPLSSTNFQFNHPASTNRPEFPHFGQTSSHNHDPSKPETFLGQITINNPDPLPDNLRDIQAFNSARIRPSYNTADFDAGFPNAPEPVNQDIYEYSEKTKATTYNPTKSDYSQRIKPSNRIVFNSRPSYYTSPKTEEQESFQKKPVTSSESYFNSNENNFSNTRSRFKPKPTSTTTPHPQTERKNRFFPSTKSPNKAQAFNLRSNKVNFSPNKPHYSSTTEYKPMFDLEPLLEDEIPSIHFGDTLKNPTNGSEDVEVIKSVEVTSTASPSTIHEDIVKKNITVENVSKEVKTTVTPVVKVNYTTEKVIPVVEEEVDPGVNINPTEYLHESEDYQESGPASDPSEETPKHEEPRDHTEKGHDDSEHETDSGVTEYYDEEVEYVDESDVLSDPSNDKAAVHHKKVHEGHHEDHDDEQLEYEDVDESETPIDDSTTVVGEKFDILTMKPMPMMVKDDNFKGFVDSALIDNTEPPTFVTEQYAEPDEPHQTTVDSIEPTTTDPPPILLGEEVVSVVTTKSVVNGTFSVPEYSDPPARSTSKMEVSTAKPEESTLEGDSEKKGQVSNATESWVVVASVQTSRSVSGARFLPFPGVAQDEKKQTLAELDEEREKEESEPTKDSEDETEETTTTEEYTTDLITKSPASTESIIDKLDRVQSELSSGFLSGGFKGEDQDFDVLTEMPHENMTKIEESSTVAPPLQIFTVKSTTSTSTTERGTPEPLPVTIKKFSPYSRPTTTPKPKQKAPVFETIVMDDLTGLLPAGFKVRTSFKDRKITTTTSKPKPTQESQGRASGQSFKNKVVIQDNLSSLLPKGYKPTKEEKPISIEDLFKNVKSDDLSHLLPPGFKVTTEAQAPSSTEKPKFNKPINILSKAEPVDVSSLLPKGYKLLTTTTEKAKTSKDPVLNAKPVDISSFLPPGFKLDTKNAEKEANPLKNIKFADVSSLLPPGFKPKEEEKPKVKEAPSSTEGSTTAKVAANGFKVVFPSRPGAGKPGKRLTTPRPANEGGMEMGVSSPTIQKGWPTRATTEFTGWPTPSTTPFSIEKLLEAQRALAAAKEAATEEENISSTAAPTSSTHPPTTPTTQAPTTPGVCGAECDLAATIKIIGGVQWVPELLDHNTKEWQLLANEVSRELDSAYSKSPALKKWYKGIRIDGFSKGSVLVDYFVELNEIEEKIDTTELKKLFHTSLNDARPGSVVTEVPKVVEQPDRLTARKIDGQDQDMMLGDQPQEDRLDRNRSFMEKIDISKGKLEIGRFILDPIFTEFIVLPKRMDPTIGYADDNMLLPQWGIAVIVIALASLLFVVIFGVTVLVNRQKSSKAKQPIPLSEDMLRELDKSHMGGTADDLYMHEHEPPYPPRNQKPRRGSTAMLEPLAYPGNPGDSWRSEWGPYYNQYHQHYAPDSGRGSQSYTGGNTNYGYSGSQTYGYNGGGGGSQNYGYTGDGVRTLYPPRRSDFDSNF